MKSIFGIDLIETGVLNPISLTVKKAGSNRSVNYATEDDHSGFDSNIFNNPEFDVRYFFKDLSPSDIDDLINKRAYLEFWLPVVDHDMSRKGISGNGKYYSAEDIDGAMTPHFISRMNTGGVEGELDHPQLHVYSDNEKSIMNFKNNLDRISRIDKDNVVWYIVGFKRHNNISFFKFRTSLSNNKVVMDMLNGKAPSASLRVTGDFRQDPNTGIWRGTNIRFVTIDYVDNPGFKTATLFSGAIDLVKSGSSDLKKVQFCNNSNKTNPFALESEDDTKYVNEVINNKDVYMLNSLYIMTETKPKKERVSLDTLIDRINVL